MRILHTSDWHLGRTFHGRVLDEAHAVFADHVALIVHANRGTISFRTNRLSHASKR